LPKTQKFAFKNRMAQHRFLFELTQVERQAPDEIIRALRSVQGTIAAVCRS
jgi:hypothetical protein